MTTRANYRTVTTYRTKERETRGHDTYANALTWAQVVERVNGIGNVQVRIFSNRGDLAFSGWLETRGHIR